MNRLYTVMEVSNSNPVTVPCFVCLFFSCCFFFDFIFLFIYRYNCLNKIHNHFKTIWVAEYHFNDSKQCIPY